MAASYPSSVVALSTKNDGDTVFASHVDALQDEIIAVENGLLTGIAHNVLPDANNTRDLGSVAKAWANIYAISLKVNGIALQAPLVQTTTLTGTQNDFVLTTPANVLVLRCNNATDITFTGFVAGTDGQVLIVESIGAGNVFVKHQNAGSAAANRAINFATSGDTPGATGSGMFVFVYDGTTARWRLVQHEQGDYISYAGTSTITGWASRTTTVIRYYLRGKVLQLQWDLQGTSNAVTMSFTIPFTTQATGVTSSVHQVTDNGATPAAGGMVQFATGATVINFYKDFAGTAWTNINGKNSNGTLTFGVQ